MKILEINESNNKANLKMFKEYNEKMKKKFIDIDTQTLSAEFKEE